MNKLKSNINLNQKTMKRIALILMVLGCCMSSIRAQETVTRYETAQTRNLLTVSRHHSQRTTSFV